MTQEPSNGQAPRGVLVVTNMIRLGGLALAMKAGFAPTTQSGVEFGVAVFMMAGATGIESFARSFFGK